MFSNKIQLLLLTFLASCVIAVLADDYEVTVTNVTVWVKATDKSGKPVLNLTQDDFQVTEDKQKMALTCFEELVQPALQTAPAKEGESEFASTAAETRIVLLVDLYNTSQPEFLFIKPKLLDFLENTTEKWQVMVASLLPSGVLEVNESFTGDLAEVSNAIEKLRANPERDIDILNKRKEVTNVFESRGLEKACYLAQDYASEEEATATSSLESIEAFEKELIKMKDDAHMVVFFVSGGINSEPGQQYFDMLAANFPDQRDMILQYPECQLQRRTGLRQDLDELIGKLNRHNVTFYTVSTRGMVNPTDSVMEAYRKQTQRDFHYEKDYQDFIEQIADETGGQSFTNSLNFKAGFNSIMDDLNHQYLLCYKAPQHKKQGEYHKIKVNCKKSGVNLRYRLVYLD
jgi:VWFA-related protein